MQYYLVVMANVIALFRPAIGRVVDAKASNGVDVELPLSATACLLREEAKLRPMEAAGINEILQSFYSVVLPVKCSGRWVEVAVSIQTSALPE